MAATLAGIIADYLEKNDRDVPLAELHAAVVAGGLKDRSEAQVYAGVQSMASTGKCGRGQSARTYCRNQNAAPRPSGILSFMPPPYCFQCCKDYSLYDPQPCAGCCRFTVTTPRLN